MGEAVITSNLLKVVEVWTPAENGQLTVDSAIYQGVEAFEEASRNLTLAEGTGLPGWVWSAGVPVLFDDLNSADFVRNEAAAESNLGAGFGLPVFDGDDLAAVMIFLFDSHELATGAFESWLPNDVRNELELGTGYYSKLERFRRLSQYLRFPYGAGLPGEVWQTLTPALISRLGEAAQFLRASGAEADGLESGLAVPVVQSTDTLRSVFVMLSGDESPIARVLSTWVPSADGGFGLSAATASGIDHIEGILARDTRVATSFVTHVVESRIPILENDLASMREFSILATEEQLSWALGWPVVVNNEVQAVCVILD